MSATQQALRATTGPRARGRAGAAEDGFSLIEVLTAIALLAFITVGIMSFLSVSLKLNRLSIERSTATGLATDRLEQATSVGFKLRAKVADYQVAGETMSGADPTWTFTADYGDIPGFDQFSRVLTVTYDSPIDGMMLVKCDVIWRNVYEGDKRHTMIIYLEPNMEKKE